MNPLKFGVIGLSAGNGHPYSWSAIFNGYDPVAMEGCGFPVIPRYLEQHQFPEEAISEGKVTHVWAQDKKIAAHIAKAALIDNVVDHCSEMIGQVDGVLLARDDAETHLEFAAPFLNAGIPIYIDKPLALSVAEAKQLIGLQQYSGQLFSCSALRYAEEFKLSEADSAKIGPLRHIHATVPKDWDKYAPHVIEPLLLLANGRGAVERTQAWRHKSATTLSVEYSSGLQVLVSAMGSSSAPLALRVMGEIGWKDLFFQDSYSAFKSALFEFVQGIIHRDVRIEPDFMLEVVNLIESGRVQ
ncbi:MAG: Gfo/Idh/MocA family oxidoreductase [Chlorobiaceae bacterium]|nr:Gfo/Idh/MocA family oxidoreductase [Chlorobiaceae bacterium]